MNKKVKLYQIRVFLILFVAINNPAFSGVNNFGKFTTPLRFEYVDDLSSGWGMRLLEDFVYIDPSENEWRARKGFVTDGASIPRPLWEEVGSPYTGRYLKAAVIHDQYLEDGENLRKDVDRIFYYACKASGVSEMNAMILYAGVRANSIFKYEIKKYGLKNSPKSKCFQGCHGRSQKGHQFGAIPSDLLDLPDRSYISIIEWVKLGNRSLLEVDDFIKAYTNELAQERREQFNMDAHMK